MAQCNTWFTALYYFFESCWSLCRLIINLKPKWLNPLKSMNLCDWSIILGGRIKTPSEVRNHPRGTPKFTQLEYSQQMVNTVRLWASALQLRRQSLLHSRWWLSSSSSVTTNHSDNSKNILGMSSTSSLLKEIITCKICRRNMFYLSFNVITT